MLTKIPVSMMAEYYTTELQDFLCDLGEIATLINPVEMLTATNAASEKKKFLELTRNGRHVVNPHFEYNTELLKKIAHLFPAVETLGKRLSKVLDGLSKEEPGRILGAITHARYQEVGYFINLATNVLAGNDLCATTILDTVYGFPSNSTINLAYEYATKLAQHCGTRACHDEVKIANYKRLNAMKLGAEQIRDVFNWAMERSGIGEEWPVVIDSTATYIDVRDKSSQGKCVVVPKDIMISGNKLVTLTIHEVECHAQDSVRATEALPFLGSGHLKPACEIIYEGHAMLAETYTKQQIGEKVPLHGNPFAIITLDLARSGLSFSEISQRVFELIRPTEATDEKAWDETWRKCYRIMRGSTGKATHYCFSKDRAYFEGLILAKRWHSEGRDAMLQLGTLSLKDLELLERVVEFGEETEHFKQIQSLADQLSNELIAEYA